MRIDELTYKKLTLLFIGVLSILLLLIVTLRPIAQWGESDTYMLPVIAIEQRTSLVINQSDIDKARIDFKDLFSEVENFDDLRCSKLVKIDQNNWLPWYFPTYAIAVLPFKILLEVLGLNQTYSFLIANVFFYTLALSVVYKKLNTTPQLKFYLILLLGCSPILFYTIFWISAESLIFSLVTMSLVYFTNKEYKKAALLVSIAGTMNPTIMIYGAVVLISYFMSLCIAQKSKYGNINYKGLVIDNIKDIIITGILFVPCLVPFLYFYLYIGKINPTVSAGTLNYFWERFFSYLFDLNLGFIAFVPLIIISFFFMATIGVIKKNKETILYIIAFLGTVLAYSGMSHINSGMTGIARYSAWVLPIMIFYVCTVGHELIKKTLLPGLFKIVIYGSVVLSVLITYTSVKTPYGLMYTYHSPIAVFVLDNYPVLYNPYYATFISRTEHIDGGYVYSKPVIYTDKNDNIRKILVTGDTTDTLEKLINVNEESGKILNEEISKIKGKPGYHYISIPKKYEVKFNNTVKLEIESLTQKVLLDKVDKIVIDKKENDLFVYSVPIQIKSNQLYKIEFKADSKEVSNELFVDLYGNDGKYDSSEQEIHFDINKESNIYEAVFSTGECGAVKNGSVRFVSDSSGGLVLSQVRVYLMKK